MARFSTPLVIVNVPMLFRLFSPSTFAHTGQRSSLLTPLPVDGRGSERFFVLRLPSAFSAAQKRSGRFSVICRNLQKCAQIDKVCAQTSAN